jgi:hypothetical protein
VAEIEQFIRDAARKRGIDPDIAVRVAKSEGSVTEPARLGDFSGHPWYSGKSWWPFQLHYGGRGYEHYGNTAGMGNHFTELTGWQPGDPRAWQDSVRYALNRAKAGGWKPWYGAAHVGIGEWEGIDRSHPWDAHAEPWDYETGGGSVPKVTFNSKEPPHIQEHDYDCSQDALEWAMWSLGRKPTENWMHDTMIAEGVMTPQVGLTDASGAGLAAFVKRHYGEFGFDANNENPVSFQALAEEIGPYPMLIGGRAWNHWSGLWGYDPGQDVLLLANPAPGWKGVGQTMGRQQFAALGTFSMVRVLHPDLLGAITVPPPRPQPSLPTRAEMEHVRAQIDSMLAEIAARLPA